MRLLQSFVSIAILSWLLQLFLPWWSLAIAAFGVALALLRSGFAAFFAGFLGTSIVWWIYALFIEVETGGLLAEKMAVLFKIGNPFLLLVLTGLVAGIVGGFAALSGAMLKNILSKQ